MLSQDFAEHMGDAGKLPVFVRNAQRIQVKMQNLIVAVQQVGHSDVQGDPQDVADSVGVAVQQQDGGFT